MRAFIAFDLENEEVKKKLTEVQSLLTKTRADIKLVELENIHITMRFLGDITPAMVDKVYGEIKRIQFKEFKIKIECMGTFPNLNYPRVVWARITQGTDQLQNIFSQLEPNLQKLGFTQDSKGFNPHLTIARVRSPLGKNQLIEFIQKNNCFNFGETTAASLRLKRSQLTPQGPIYSTLKEQRSL